MLPILTEIEPSNAKAMVEEDKTLVVLGKSLKSEYYYLTYYDYEIKKIVQYFIQKDLYHNPELRLELRIPIDPNNSSKGYDDTFEGYLTQHPFSIDTTLQFTENNILPAGTFKHRFFIPMPPLIEMKEDEANKIIGNDNTVIIVRDNGDLPIFYISYFDVAQNMILHRRMTFGGYDPMYINFGKILSDAFNIPLKNKKLYSPPSENVSPILTEANFKPITKITSWAAQAMENAKKRNNNLSKKYPKKSNSTNALKSTHGVDMSGVSMPAGFVGSQSTVSKLPTSASMPSQPFMPAGFVGSPSTVPKSSVSQIANSSRPISMPAGFVGKVYKQGGKRTLRKKRAARKTRRHSRS